MVKIYRLPHLFIRKPLLFLSAFIIFSAQSFADQASLVIPLPKIPPPQLKLAWVTPYGKIVKIPSRARAEWIYYSKKAPLPSSGLHLKIWVELPSKYMIKNNRDDTQRIDPFPSGPSPFRKNSNYVFSLIAEEEISHFAIQLQRSESAPPEHLNLVITSKMAENTLELDSSCSDLGVNASQIKRSSETSAVYMLCQSSPQNVEAGIDVYTLYSKDFKMGTIQGIGKKNEEQSWSVFHLSTFKKNNTPAAFDLIQTEDESVNRYTFSVLEPFESNKRFGWSGGIGGTGAWYSEVPLKSALKAVKMNQTALTGKINASYQLNTAFNVSGNVFLTLLPVTHSPSTTLAHRTLGSSLRFGYILPFKTKLSWKVSAGSYYWKMIVPSNAYGVSVVATQVFLEFLGSTSTNKNYYGYLKISPIPATENFISFQNRELAFGGGYQLSKITEKKPWFATLDFADFRFTNTKVAYVLTSFTLGVQRRF